MIIKEDLVKDMFDEHVSRVRYTDDKASKCFVFDNQIDTAKEIIYNFYIQQNRWCLLFAEMQSGKSGTFFSVPYIIGRNAILTKKLGIDLNQNNNNINVFLLTGMNEKELIEQFEKDIVGFTGMDIDKNVLHNSEMNSRFLKTPEMDWSNDDKVLVSKIKKNSLILIDESHYGSDKKQILNNFLTKIVGIEPNGDNTPLIKNNIYVVSISATPMAEFIQAKTSNFKKKIIPLKNSDGYYGIIDMFNNNKIHDASDLKDVKSIDRFIDRFLNISRNGYILIRSTKHQEEIKNRLGERLIDVSVECYDSDKGNKNKTIDGLLEETPIKKTIIFLKGKLRAGKRINTRNIIMIHDTAESKVDTTVQSLLGRCCGYNKNKDIEIYCDMISAKKYKNWIESGFDVNMVPDKSKNVLKNSYKSVYITTIIKPSEYKASDLIKNIMNNRRRTIKEKEEIIKELNILEINQIIDTDNYEIYLVSPGRSLGDESYIKNYRNSLQQGYYLGESTKFKDENGNIKSQFKNKYIIFMAYDKFNYNIQIGAAIIKSNETDNTSANIVVSDNSMY
jgi:hypothetical protein